MGATVNVDVDALGSRWPRAPFTPWSPPGTVTETVAPGARGAAAWKASVSGVVWTQDPATGGFNVGVGESVANGTLKCTLSAASEATSDAWGAGEVDTTSSGPAEAPEEVFCDATALEGPSRVSTSATLAEATAPATTRVVMTTHRCRASRWRRWFARDMGIATILAAAARARSRFCGRTRWNALPRASRGARGAYGPPSIARATVVSTAAIRAASVTFPPDASRT